MDSVLSVFFEKTYYVVPDSGDKAYALLVTAIHKEQKMAIAQVIIESKEILIALTSNENGLAAETLHYLEEIKPVPKPLMMLQLSTQELDMARMLIRSIDRVFGPTLYHDSYRKHLMSAIQFTIQIQIIALPRDE